ncbi:MAG: polymer-forming cytoskeletal protein [Clostridia bacterium]
MNLKKFKYVSVDVLIGEKTRLTGDLDSESAIKIDGAVQGNIRTAREVILSETAVVEGDIQAGSLIVAGRLTGNATAVDQLLIKETGVLEGNIETGSLVIEEGGMFIGMNRSIKKESPAETAEAPEDMTTANAQDDRSGIEA